VRRHTIMTLYLYLNYTWSRPEVAAATSRSEWDTMDEGCAKETENGTEILKNNLLQGTCPNIKSIHKNI